MADRSRIEWCDASWNPIRARLSSPVMGEGDREAVEGATQKTGWHCTHVSEGCRNCYAETMNRRLGTGLDYKPSHFRVSGDGEATRPDRVAENDIELFLDEKMLMAPLRWKRPRKIFVGSMTDLFADFVKDEWRDRIFAVMALCPQHTFQLLTKRPERMLKFLAAKPRTAVINGHIWSTLGTPRGSKIKHGGNWRCVLPLQNVWLGTSCEDQPAADERIPHLLATPAAVLFLSLEPLLGPIDLRNVAPPELPYCGKASGTDVLTPHNRILRPQIDWVIVGGESGSQARPMHPDWARALRDQCTAAGVPFFFKQWGEWFPRIDRDRDDPDGRRNYATGQGEHPARRIVNLAGGFGFHGERVHLVERLGKSRAGRTLDGVEHNATPAPHS